MEKTLHTITPASRPFPHARMFPPMTTAYTAIDLNSPYHAKQEKRNTLNARRQPSPPKTARSHHNKLGLHHTNPRQESPGVRSGRGTKILDTAHWLGRGVGWGRFGARLRSRRSRWVVERGPSCQEFQPNTVKVPR